MKTDNILVEIVNRDFADNSTIYSLSAYLLTTLWISSLVAAGVFANANGLAWVPFTVPDFKNRDIHLTLPLQRIVILDSSVQIIMATYALKIHSLLVGIDEYSAKCENFFPDGPICPTVGTTEEPDIEKICSLDPDLILVGNLSDEIIAKMEKAHLVVASISVFPNQNDGFDQPVDVSLLIGEILEGLQRIPERFDTII